MQRINDEMKNKALKFLESSAGKAVLAWKKGDLPYDVTPALFYAPDSLDNMIYNNFCACNLSKYLIENRKNVELTLVFLKPCDTYSFNQLLLEHRIERDSIYTIGVACNGMLDIEKLRDKGVKGILSIEEDGETIRIQTLYGNEKYNRQDLLLNKCLFCKGKDHKVYDELIGADLFEQREFQSNRKFDEVSELEGMTADERFSFWRRELSKCIRCNACRNICPACTCNKCIFDNSQSGSSAKVNVTDFEENLYHIIRAYHVAGRCSDCGECSRVCPQKIPLYLLNRKLIKDIKTFYGDFQAGETSELFSPLLNYSHEDAEPNVISKKGGDN